METTKKRFLLGHALPHIARSVFLQAGFNTMLECRLVCSAWARAIDQALLESVFMADVLETHRMMALWSERTPRVQVAFGRQQGFKNEVNRMYVDRGEVFACLRDGRVRVFRASTGTPRGTVVRWWHGMYNIHDFELTFSKTSIIVRYPMSDQHHNAGIFVDIPERLLVVNRRRLEQVAAFTASNMFTKLLMAETVFDDVVMRCEYNPEVPGALSLFVGSVSQRTLSLSRIFPIKLTISDETTNLDSSVLLMEDCFTSVCADGFVKLIDYDSGEDRWRAAVVEEDSLLAPIGLSLKAEGKVLVVALFDNVQATVQISIVSVSNGSLIRSLSFANGTFCRAHTVSDKRLYYLNDELFSAASKRSLSVLNLQTLESVDTDISQLVSRKYFVKELLAARDRILLMCAEFHFSTFIFVFDVSSDTRHVVLSMMHWPNQMWGKLFLLSDYELAFRDVTQKAFMVASFVSKSSLSLPLNSGLKYCFYFNRALLGCKNSASTCAFLHERAPACRYGQHCANSYCAFQH